MSFSVSIDPCNEVSNIINNIDTQPIENAINYIPGQINNHVISKVNTVYKDTIDEINKLNNKLEDGSNNIISEINGAYGQIYNMLNTVYNLISGNIWSIIAIITYPYFIRWWKIAQLIFPFLPEPHISTILSIIAGAFLIVFGLTLFFLVRFPFIVIPYLLILFIIVMGFFTKPDKKINTKQEQTKTKT